MAKEKSKTGPLTSADLRGMAVEGPVSGNDAKAPAAAVAAKPAARRTDGMVRLQQIKGGSISHGRSGEMKGQRDRSKPVYRWTGQAVQTVPLAVARELMTKFRGRFRCLDPM